MHKTGLVTISQAVQQLIAQSPYKHKLAEAAIICAWKQVMPPTVLQRTEQTFVKQDKLFIKINSAPLRQELRNMQEQVLERLRAAVPDCTITALVFL